MSHALTQKMNYMKSKHRTETLLKSWSADNYYLKQNEKNNYQAVPIPEDFQDNIDRVHVNDLTIEQFIERYEKGNKPVIVQGAADDWPAKTAWNFNVSVLQQLNQIIFVAEFIATFWQLRVQDW